MKQSRIGCVGVTILVALIVTGCAQAEPSKTVTEYLQARVDGDVTQLIRLSCPAWEASARIEASTFAAMQAHLEDVECASSDASEGNKVVTCKGRIVTTYNGEAREWDLAQQQYLLVPADGEWLFCGYW